MTKNSLIKCINGNQANHQNTKSIFSIKRPSMTKASVILTSYNNSHNLKKCLVSLINQCYDWNLIDLEIIVVDSGSTDDSIEILNNYKDKIKIILNRSYSHRLSPAMARNIGVQRSKGNILIFSDTDCCLPPNWIKNIISFFKNPNIDCVVGSREPDKGEGVGTFYRKCEFILRSRKFAISKSLLINRETVHREVPLILIAANNFAIKKEVWNKLGGMKTSFRQPAGEDIMLELEILKRGYNILFTPAVKVIHNHPLSLKKLFRKAFQQGESIALINKYFKKHIYWKHFLQLKNFLKNIFFFGAFFLIIIIVNLSWYYKIITLFDILLVIIGNETLKAKKRLGVILKNKNKICKKKYRLSFLELFYFVIIDFFVKSARLGGFIYSSSKLRFNFNK